MNEKYPDSQCLRGVIGSPICRAEGFALIVERLYGIEKMAWYAQANVLQASDVIFGRQIVSVEEGSTGLNPESEPNGYVETIMRALDRVEKAVARVQSSASFLSARAV